ncbi:hypothetical protein Q8A67_021899 [Cirrhinus molitorella]|uniref:Uncharacterized protein n=1 Tax=Cirrhinus molitorella TaxID=172907 RepID=A0AA88P9C2_9TELE|nr:hypothetical protein Q8A67_021899 [Cirrhinus molitorella]
MGCEYGAVLSLMGFTERLRAAEAQMCEGVIWAADALEEKRSSVRSEELSSVTHEEPQEHTVSPDASCMNRSVIPQHTH